MLPEVGAGGGSCNERPIATVDMVKKKNSNPLMFSLCENIVNVFK